MKDVVRSAPARDADKGNNRRSGREQGSIVGYCAIAFVFVSLIVLVLCLTVFFKVKMVEINGVTLYRDDQILGVGGILKDENLVRTDTALIKKRLEENLVFIEEAKVEKKYPSTLIISVTEAQKAADIVVDDKVCVVSASGRVLEMGNARTTGGIPVVRGFELTSKKVGDKLASKDESKLKIYNDLMKNISAISMDKITEIDLSSRSGIIMLYDGRITLELGSSMDLDYKLNYFKSVIDSKLSGDFKGKLVYNGSDSGISAIPEGAAKKDDAKDDTTSAEKDKDKDKDKDKQTDANTANAANDQAADANANANANANADTNANANANADQNGSTNYGYMQQQDQGGTQNYGYMQQDQGGTGYDYGNGATDQNYGGYDYNYNNGGTGYDYGGGAYGNYDYNNYNNGSYDYNAYGNYDYNNYNYGGYDYNNGAANYNANGTYDYNYNTGGYGY